MSELSFGALVRRDHLRRHPFGFHPFSGFPVCVRLVLIDRGAGSEETMRVRFESVMRGAKIKDTNVDPRSIIDWWREPSLTLPLRKLLTRIPVRLEDPQVFLLDGNCEIVP